jgi:hypothetical protein
MRLPWREGEPARRGSDTLTSHNTCRVVVGRLVEAAVPDGYRTVADVDDMIGKVSHTLSQLNPAVRAVIVADWRQCKVLTPAVSERMAELMVHVNARIERSAVLHAADSSTSVLQLMRLIRETNAPNRRLFTDPSQLRAWLDEVLDDRERERLREFLGGPRLAAPQRQ